MSLKYFTPLAILLFSLHSNAQSYVFTKTTTAYAPLSGATTITTDFLQNTYNITIPAKCKTFGHDMPVIMKVSKNGYLESTGPTYSFSFLPYNKFLTPRSANSALLYKIETIGNDTILKVEWRDINVTGSPATDSLNFQAWYYKANQAIEFHYGPSHTTTGFDDPFINISLTSADFNTSYESHTLIGTAATVSDDETVNTQNVFGGNIPTGTVYRFNIKPTGITSASTPSPVLVYPNPTMDGIVHIKAGTSSALPFCLSNLQGSILKTGIINNTADIDFSALPKTTYLLKVGTGVHKILNQ